MKKLLTLLLAFVLTLFLVSCGGDVNNDKPQSALALLEDKLSSVQDCVAILRVQINPAFDLYLDENDRVVAIDAVNDDAKLILSDTQVVGENGVDAIGRLLEEANRKGFVGNTVYVTPVYRDGNTSAAALVNDLPDALAHLNVSFEMDEDGVVEVTSSSPSGGNNALANTTTTEKDREGNTISRYYDKNGRMVREVTEFVASHAPESKPAHRQEITFDQSGVPVTIVIEYANGDHYEAMLVNGKHASSTLTAASGARSQTTYDANGIAGLTTGTNADGGSFEELYYANGEIKQHTVRYDDGSYNIQNYDENGVKRSEEGEYVRYDGVLTWWNNLYDAGGNHTEHFGRDNFDRPVHTVFYGDGSSMTEVTESDGSVRIIHRDAAGNETYS